MDKLFSRKLFPSSIQAGLLAYSTFDNLPVPTTIGTVVLKDQKLMELTAAGTAPDFLITNITKSNHRIPVLTAFIVQNADLH